MKPRVAILGHNEPNGREYLESVNDSDFSIEWRGHANDLQFYTDSLYTEIKQEFDAVIVHCVGPSSAFEAASFALRFRGGRAKVAVWSMDSHNPEWALKESQFTSMFTAWFTSHSEWLPTLGGRSIWMPSYLPRLPKENKPRSNQFDVVSFLRWSRFRGPVVNRIRELLDYMGFTYFIGETTERRIVDAYRLGRCALNVNQNTDLNIRQFEALAAGTPVVMTPAFDWNSSLFDDLRSYSVLLDREADSDSVRKATETAMALDASRAVSIVMSKHQLIHRYVSIAEKIL